AFDVGGTPDVLAYDPALRTVYVAGEAGVVSMFHVDTSHVVKIGDGRVGPDAHVVSVDAASHDAWLRSRTSMDIPCYGSWRRDEGQARSAV
ncbi:hypothetical protein K6Y76_37380, partial [Burkholderia cenocepacia]|nr:hypothetical protein [Burkholderia cenocepacia]